ncbi:hypothetical protein BV394_12675 [Brevirhabdus pacifica]|uniref:Uncharacterized protein n=1 Tax=Brevirhabdus pacifica TaxID=1267768 RepID=A0A1U7DKG2_9RHOB|nr:tripartite tricarboxylate transporter TctB family protein [Brevirhabdus pacifica]APX90476.1 hypothetical protein BV394_12675 [Brevirhabdus pacifica]OWU78509.1 hypothetical protein ATO5_06790 [Loktanella sp. 22II-4b]PJJ85420.1 tripartite tricarboxylate transporter TctB family protein [Brevirhabdus pacifica]
MQVGSETGRPVEAGRLPRDMAVGFVILLFCAVAYWVSLDIQKAPAALAQNVQPATFPRMVLAVIAALTVLMMALGLGQPEPARRAPKIIMLVTGALMVAFVMAFEALGPLAAMFLFCIVMPLTWGERFTATLVLYALGFPVAVYLLFDVLLKVHFPPGVVEGLIDKMI